MFLTKFLGWGGQGFQEKLPVGGWSPFFGFYCIFINMCFEICLRGGYYIYPHPPVCIYGVARNSRGSAI